MPDDELLRVAERGTLRRPEVIEAQVRRMLADPKISRLVENFGGQWLQFRGLESHQPDFYLYPAFDNYLRNLHGRRRPRLFFENLIREDRSILDFLDADYTFRERISRPVLRSARCEGPRVPQGEPGEYAAAGHSGAGQHADDVVVRQSHLGGAARQVGSGEPAEHAAATAAAGRARSRQTRKSDADATLRQRMEVHRDNAVCASCHSKMDPIGFGLENFDAVGNWREKDGKTPIDASGKLPDGRTFNGPVGIGEVVAVRRATPSPQCMAEKMMIFALGRGLEAYDRPR